MFPILLCSECTVCFQAVFERLMLDDADECVVTSTKTAPDMTSVNRAAEHEALRYLFCCFRRWLDVTTQCEVSLGFLFVHLLVCFLN